MERNIKAELDEFVPLHITLYEDEKNTIVREAKQRVTNGKRKSFSFKPAFISIAMLLIIGFFITPAIQKEFLTSSPFTPQKVTVEGVEYDSLINSIYLDSINELVYTDHKGIYSFNTVTNEKNNLVEPVESASIYKSDFVASEKWLIWQDLPTFKLNILERKTGKLKTLDDHSILPLLLVDNLLFYTPSMEDNQRHYTYNKLDLNTLEETVVHQMGTEGSNSIPMIAEGKFLISEYVKTESGDKETAYFVYDIFTNELIGKYTVPYEFAWEVTLTDNKIYGSLSNKDEPPILGYVDLSDGQFYQVEAPTFHRAAVHGNYVALSIPVEDSNTVKLYQLEDNKLVPLSTFNHIKERLVKPRFTSEGTLVLNGEGPDHSMYLVKTNE